MTNIHRLQTLYLVSGLVSFLLVSENVAALGTGPGMGVSPQTHHLLVPSDSPAPTAPFHDDRSSISPLEAQILAARTVGISPIVDGNLSDVEYQTIGTKQNSNSGFGPNIDVSKIVYYSDVQNQRIYVGVQGKFNVGSNDAIGIMLNVAGPGSPAGKPAGQALGILNNGGSYIGASNNPANVNFKAGFEVDYMFAFNPGGGTTTIFVDAAKHVNSSVLEYQGSCDQSGTATSNTQSTGLVFPQNAMIFAVNNGGGANQGIEFSLPWSAIGADPAMSIQAFAFVVSASAYFSDVTVPGNVPPTIGDANPGFNADFSTLPGGPYYTDPAVLPVQLASFRALQLSPTSIRLDWRTNSEVDNYGFEVEKSPDGSSFTICPNSFIPGHGTTLTPHDYTWTDTRVYPGHWYYRLRQMDLNGTVRYTDPIAIAVVTAVEETSPQVFALSQNYPNPFNPSTEISFSVENTAPATLIVYNALGERVATLFDGMAVARLPHRVQFDGSGLPSGMYVCKLESGSRIAVRKLLLMK